MYTCCNTPSPPTATRTTHTHTHTHTHARRNCKARYNDNDGNATTLCARLLVGPRESADTAAAATVAMQSRATRAQQTIAPALEGLVARDGCVAMLPQHVFGALSQLDVLAATSMVLVRWRPKSEPVKTTLAITTVVATTGKDASRRRQARQTRLRPRGGHISCVTTVCPPSPGKS